MKIGKIPQETLRDQVLGELKKVREEVLIYPETGEDCSAVALQEDEVFVLSTDPITGATANIGSIAVNINANDLASSGAEPLGLMVTLLLPPDIKEVDIQNMMREISTACQEMNMDILGGHTEVTDAVNRPVVSITALGKAKREQLVTTKGSKPGDDVIMTKWAGLEGTAIIAEDCKEQLKDVLTTEELERASQLVDCLSVLPESRIAREYGVHAMHDVTEGGLLGALWEMATCAGVGMIIEPDKISMLEETIKICQHFNIDPLKLISSGSMLICANQGEGLVTRLKEVGIQAAVIGKVTAAKDICTKEKGQLIPIEEPDVDELYKVI